MIGLSVTCPDRLRLSFFKHHYKSPRTLTLGCGSITILSMKRTIPSMAMLSPVAFFVHEFRCHSAVRLPRLVAGAIVAMSMCSIAALGQTVWNGGTGN
jgi:hypothetical protein